MHESDRFLTSRCEFVGEVFLQIYPHSVTLYYLSSKEDMFLS
jgi:hypothetical protein